jgi:serine/threonine protein kinase
MIYNAENRIYNLKDIYLQSRSTVQSSKVIDKTQVFYDAEKTLLNQIKSGEKDSISTALKEAIGNQSSYKIPEKDIVYIVELLITINKILCNYIQEKIILSNSIIYNQEYKTSLSKDAVAEVDEQSILSKYNIYSDLIGNFISREFIAYSVRNNSISEESSFEEDTKNILSKEIIYTESETKNIIKEIIYNLSYIAESIKNQICIKEEISTVSSEIIFREIVKKILEENNIYVDDTSILLTKEGIYELLDNDITSKIKISEIQVKNIIEQINVVALAILILRTLISGEEFYRTIKDFEEFYRTQINTDYFYRTIVSDNVISED